MPPSWEHPSKGLAGTYGRVSTIRTDIAQDSRENQDRLNRRAALLHGLKIKHGYEFSDHGKSASKNIERGDLERAINAVVRQEIEALIVPTVDRLSRLGMRHIGEMLDAVEGARGRIIFVKEALDSSQPISQGIIAFLAEQARTEASNLSWRIETWHEGCRLKGKWAGKRPYGYLVSDGKLTPHPDEALVVQQIVADFLAGQPIRQIAKALNDKGVPAPAASKAAGVLKRGREPKKTISTWWSTSAVSRVLRNPNLVGWQRHNGSIVLGPDGEPVSFGEGILAPGEHARVLAEVDRRTAIIRISSTETRQAGTKTGGGRPPRYLLVGIARCKACAYAMNGHPGNNISEKAPYYKCSSLNHGQPCPAPAYITVEKADTEAMRQVRARLAAMESGNPILDVIAERWRGLTVPEGEGERAVLQSRLYGVRGRIVDLEEARYVRGEFTFANDIARWNGMMARLKAQRDAVLQKLDELGPPPDFDLNTLRATYLREVWDAMSLVQRRKLLQIAVAQVLVTSANKRLVPARDRISVVLVGEESESQSAG